MNRIKILFGILFFTVLIHIGCKCPCETVKETEGYSIKGIAQSADGSDILYELTGKGDLSLVFVHGWSCDRSYWDAQMKEFSKSYRVVTVDLAGHGGSSTNRMDYTIQSFGEDVAAVVKKLELDRVILVGHSMGGMVILEVENILKDNVIGLVIVDMLQDVEVKYPDEAKQKVLENVKSDFRGFVTGFVKSFFRAHADPDTVSRITEDMASAPVHVGYSAIKNTFNYDVLHRVDSLEKPVFSINSDLYPTNVEANKRHFVDYTLKEMKNTGHFLMIEEPDAFNSLLSECIVELTGGYR